MAGRDRNRAGGRANEAGSTYRAGLAAYVAAHGLADVPLMHGDGANPGSPVFMWVETTGRVDDLRCRFASGDRWDVQAKRNCRWGSPFHAVLEQWIGAVRAGDLGERDRVVLASSKLSSSLRDLGSGLRRLREPAEGGLLAGERRQYNRLRAMAAEDDWLDVFDAVVRHGLVVEVRSETVADPGFREAAALLDGTVVARGQGRAAMDALARFFHTEAARSGASGHEQWLRVLDDAGLSPAPASVAASAGRARALSDYRQTLADRGDLLNVDHLAGGVPPMPAPDLLATFRIDLPNTDDRGRSTSASLANVARRWPRVVIVGLPGTGKTTALEQLAAAWAGDLDAPLPVLIRLHLLVPALRNRAPLDLADVVRLGDGVPAPLVSLLVERLTDGTGALLLDGLDECRDQQGSAVSLVRRLATDLHPVSGLVLSARETVADLAGATGLPVTHLTEPQHLTSHVGELVEHVIRSAGGDRGDDLSTVGAWVDESQSAHPDVWRIPLFAVLLAVHAAQTPSGRLPRTRAEALVAAVRDAVSRWERHKADHPGAWHPDLHPELLLLGFADIGHAVTSGETDLDAAIAAVARTVESAWAAAPARAQAMAADVVRWWVDRVGAFAEEDNALRARVRMMGEIGDAMWAARQSPTDRRPWVERVVTDAKRFREPVLLAASLAPAIATELVEAATAPDAVLLAAEAVVQGASPGPQALPTLVDKLTCLAADPPRSEPPPALRGTAALWLRLDERQERRDGPAWRFLLALAHLPLPPALRERRDAVLSADPDPERRTVAGSLAVLADCAYDDRTPQPAERQLLKSVLALPVPERELVKYRRSRHRLMLGATEVTLSGRGGAAAGAIRLIGLDDETAAAAVRLARHVGSVEAGILRTEVVRAGFGHLVAADPLVGGTVSALQRLFGEDRWRDTRFILDVAVDQAAATPPPLPVEGWRLTGAAALFEILQQGEHAIGTGEDAVDRLPSLVRHVTRMAIIATALPPRLVAVEARRAVKLLGCDRLGTAVLLHVPPYPLRATIASRPPVTDSDVPVLAACVTSGNDWLFWLAVEWLAEGHDDGVEVLWRSLPAMAPRHRYAIADSVADAAGRTAAYADWLGGDDSMLRVAAARGIAAEGTDTERITVLASDRDLTVRLAVLRALEGHGHGDLLDAVADVALSDPPARWTCCWCGAVEASADWDCTSCSEGDRPDLAEEVRRLRKR